MRFLSCSLVLPFVLAACAAQEKTARAPAADPSDSGSSEYDQMLRTAQSHLDRGQAEPAAALASRAAEQRPEDAKAYAIWGRALATQGELGPSAQKLEKARSLGSRDRDLFLLLASVHDVAKKYDEAIAVYRDFLADHPKDVEMHQELALTLLLVEQFPDAVEQMRAAHALKPGDLQLREDLGYALLRAGRLEEAGQELEAVMQADRRRHQAILFLAKVRAEQGQSEDALRLLDSAVSLAGKDPRPVRMRAQLRALAGDHEGALSDYQALVRANAEDASALVGAVGSLVALDRLDEAQKGIVRLREIVGDLPEVAFRAAQIAWRKGDRAAVATIESFADRHPQNLEAWRELALAAQKTRNKSLAKKAAAKVKELER